MTLPVRGLLQQLRHMRQVGHQPLTTLPGQHLRAHPGQLSRLEHRSHPALAGVPGPAAQLLGHPVGQRITACGKGFGRLAEEQRRRRGAHQPGPVRLVERLQQAQPVVCGAGGEHVRVPGVDRRDPGLGQRRITGPGIAVGFDDHRDIARLQPSAVEGGPAVQQRTDIGGQIVADMGAQPVHRDGAGAGAGARDHPQPERVVARGAGQPAALMVGLNLVHDDLGTAELGAAEHHLQPFDQSGIAAPVGAEGLLVARGLRGAQVGVDIAAAEPVDGLFGVTDEHQRGLSGEGPFQDLPLHRVGVLELVDHHHRPALRHLYPCRGIGVVEGIGQPGQQIVITENAVSALPDLQLGQHVPGERQRDGGPGIGIGIGRAQFGGGVADDLFGQLSGVAVGQRGVVAILAEPGQVVIVDDLGHQFVEVLHQGQTAVAVTGHAERFQHDAAELMGGRDGGRVETGKRIAQALPPGVVIVGDQMAQQIIGGQARIFESRDGFDDLATYPLTQFLAGGAAEGDQQHLVQPGPILGDHPGDQTGQGERLPGARTCLQHRGASRRRQRTGQIESLHRTASSASSSGSHSRGA